MNEDYYLDLIARKLSGEPLSGAETNDLDKELIGNSTLKLLYQTVQQRYATAGQSLKIKNSAHVYDSICEYLNLHPVEARPQKKSRILQSHRQAASTQRYRSWWKVAASIAFFMVATFAVYQLFHQNDNDEAATVSHIVKSNPKGRKSLVTLPDGSRVKLNSESILEYDSDFGSNREVKLIGEGFFEVKRDIAHPFTVRVGDVGVRVLGTSFDVKAYPFEEKLSVSVLTGKVAVSKKSDSQMETLGILTPKKQMEVDHKFGQFNIQSFDPEKVLSWKDGVLVFDHNSFDEITQKIERWYGVDVEAKRKVKLIDGFSGRYDNESLEDVLKGMGFSCGFQYKIDKKKVVIW